MKYVVCVIDNTETGQWVIGPFNTEQEADNWANTLSVGWEWFVDELTPPIEFPND